MKPKKCKICGDEFVPQRTTQSVCDWKCALDLQAVKAEKKAKKEIREQKQKLKTKTEYLQEATQSFCRYVRQRDIHEPCISCGRMHQGQWHAGHYRTTKAAPSLRIPDPADPVQSRLAEANCWKQCQPCNTSLSGNIILYRQALVEKIGEEMVQAIESYNESKRWTVEQLQEIKKYYNKKYRELL